MLPAIMIDIVLRLCPHRYSWQLDGEALTVEPEKGVNILSDGSLKLMKPNEGKYQCFVSNKFGTAASVKSSVKLG
jgi:hypothetical protein